MEDDAAVNFQHCVHRGGGGKGAIHPPPSPSPMTGLYFYFRTIGLHVAADHSPVGPYIPVDNIK